MNYIKLFTDNLKYLRGTKSINQLAKQTGIPQATLNRYQLGKSEPTWTNLLKICEALKCTPNDFIQK